MKTMTALLLTATLAFATEDPQRNLDLKVSLDVTKTPLHDVIDQLRDATGLNFVVAEGGDTPVSIKVRDLRVRSVLQLLLKPVDLTAAWEGGAVVIRHRRCSLGFTTRLYDVRGAILRLQDFPGSDLGAGDTWSCFALIVPDEPHPAVLDEDVLTMLVRSHTGTPESWDEGSISMRNGLLVVRQTAAIHREIQALLRKLGG